MKKALFLFLCGVSFFLNAQVQEPTYYKDFTGKGEVFFNAVVSSIQDKQLEINDTTFWYLDSAIAFYKNDKCKQSQAYAVKGRMYYENEEYDSATRNYLNASKISLDTCPNFDQYYLYNSWSLLTKRINEIESSDSLNALAYKAALQLEDPTYKLFVLINKSLIFSAKEDYIMAIHILNFVNKKAAEFDLPYVQLVSLQNLGVFYIELSRQDTSKKELQDSAFVVYEKLSKLVDETTDPRLLMDMYNNIGLIHYRRGEYKKAEELYLKAVELARSHSEKSRLLIFYDNLSDLKYRQGQYKLSRDYLVKVEFLKDSLFNAEKYEILKDLEAQYQNKKQREKIFELEKQQIERTASEANQRMFLFFAMSIMLVLMIAIYGRLRYVRKSKRIVEREKKRSDDLLLNILPAEIAEELKNTGKSEAKNFDNVTVLFSDFKDFTVVSEKYSAPELVKEINFFFIGFDNIISKYGVEKIKTIGDSYMAASGVPLTNPESAKTMIMVAIEMMELTLKHNAESTAKGKPRLDMRIGLHTGPVVAGIVGVKKFQFDLWGDTVNTASRMESESATNKINISDTTYQLIKDETDFEFENRGLLDVKGKGKMQMYYVWRKQT